MSKYTTTYLDNQYVHPLSLMLLVYTTILHTCIMGAHEISHIQNNLSYEGIPTNASIAKHMLPL